MPFWGLLKSFSFIYKEENQKRDFMRKNLSLLFNTLLINVVAFGAIAHASEANSGYQCVVDTYGEYQAS